jgi:hypothetical protein
VSELKTLERFDVFYVCFFDNRYCAAHARTDTPDMSKHSEIKSAHLVWMISYIFTEMVTNNSQTLQELSGKWCYRVTKSLHWFLLLPSWACNLFISQSYCITLYKRYKHFRSLFAVIVYVICGLEFWLYGSYFHMIW